MKRIIVSLVLLVSVAGCISGKQGMMDIDTRGMHGKMLIDMQQQKGYVVEYAEDGKFYLHDISPNGSIIFRK